MQCAQAQLFSPFLSCSEFLSEKVLHQIIELHTCISKAGVLLGCILCILSKQDGWLWCHALHWWNLQFMYSSYVSRKQVVLIAFWIWETAFTCISKIIEDSFPVDICIVCTDARLFWQNRTSACLKQYTIRKQSFPGF